MLGATRFKLKTIQFQSIIRIIAVTFSVSIGFSGLLGSLLVEPVAFGISPLSTSVEGKDAYDSQDYESAILQYQAEIKKNSGNGHLFFNLGNAFYRNSSRGKSIAAYLEARRLLPRDPDVKENLKFAMSKNKDRLDAALPKSLVQSAAFWVGGVTNKELAFYCAVFFGISCLLVLPTLFFPKFELVRSAGFVFGGVSLAVVFALTINVSQEQSWGAVTASLAKVKSGPGAQNTVVFELREGAPFVARRSENSWYQIELSDGKIGWLSAADAKVYNF